MVQKDVLIGDTLVPVIEEGGEKYYPISFMTQKILLRHKNGLVTSSVRNMYKDSIREFEVDFKLGSKQVTNCIKEDVLKELLGKTQIKRLSPEKRISQNKLHSYLGIDQLIIRESIVSKLNDELINEHDEYTKEIIEHEVGLNKDTNFQLCSKCNKYHPLSNTFYNPDIRKTNGYNETCNVCIGRRSIFRHFDTDKYKAMQLGIDHYNAIKYGDIIKTYESYIEGVLKSLPNCFGNKNGYMQIIKYLNNKGKLNKNNLSVKFIVDTCKLRYFEKYLTINEVYKELYGNEPWERPWLYPNFIFKNLDCKVANTALENYIHDFNIPIEDIFNYDYIDILKKSKIYKLAARDLKYFIVQYYDFKYPGYKFKISGVNYYKEENNILFDLKWLIEKDMKIETDKIPLYLTKNVLQKICKPLYHCIVTNKNGSIYEWVDKLYPNKFIEADFEINAYRNEFDSDTESFIHELLTSKFNNVLYNPKHTERTIIIDEMIPDWFIFTNKGVWIIEYFGMYEVRNKDNNRIRSYIEKTHRKIEKYKQVEGYNFIFLYPEDIENDFLGCRDKLKEIE